MVKRVDFNPRAMGNRLYDLDYPEKWVIEILFEFYLENWTSDYLKISSLANSGNQNFC